MTLLRSPGGRATLGTHVPWLIARTSSCRRGTCWCDTSSSCAGLRTGTRRTPRRPSCACWPSWTSGRQRVGTDAPSYTACECRPSLGWEGGVRAPRDRGRGQCERGPRGCGTQTLSSQAARPGLCPARRGWPCLPWRSPVTFQGVDSVPNTRPVPSV